MNKKEWVVYLVRCVDESLYCGITNDVEKRLVAHNSGKGAKYTKSRMPVDVAGVSSKMTKSEALTGLYKDSFYWMDGGRRTRLSDLQNSPGRMAGEVKIGVRLCQCR